MYTIGQVSEMFSLPISTLRYYDKEGLFPQMERSSGIRRFSERELEALRDGFEPLLAVLQGKDMAVAVLHQVTDPEYRRDDNDGKQC